ncbi:cupin domain-containing protein [Winogradskyella sp. Asnod2-B02-A]|uniref:cupin domain-containing protein n=1 Tax=Winogradskyella sp. Asnod2-B02-A TaxID=3160583 RepID=UPI003863105E
MKFNLLILAIVLLSSCNNQNALPDPLEAGWKGEAVCEVIEENNELRVLKCTFEPGVGHEKHYHNPHVGYTLVGGKFRITDHTGTREVDVPTGYTFRKDSITSHEVLNIGETTSVYLIMEFK